MAYSISITSNGANGQSMVCKLGLDSVDKWQGIQKYLDGIIGHTIFVTIHQTTKPRRHLLATHYKLTDKLNNYYICQNMRQSIYDKLEYLYQKENKE